MLILTDITENNKTLGKTDLIAFQIVFYFEKPSKHSTFTTLKSILSCRKTYFF